MSAWNFVIAMLALAVAAAPAAGGETPAAPPSETVAAPGALAPAPAMPDVELGLSRTSVFDTPAPDPFAFAGAAAGRSALLPRSFPGAPPLVPHRVGKYLPITRAVNACADCHDDPAHFGVKVAKGEPVPMSRSHYVMVAGEQGETPLLSGRRHLCVACHVPQAGAPDLVANHFPAAKPAP